MTPPALDHAIKKCLAKVPDERWQSASDLAAELKWIARGWLTVTSGPVTQRKRSRGWRGPCCGASCRPSWQPSRPCYLESEALAFPPLVSPHGDYAAARSAACRTGSTAVALAPDGLHLAYVAVQGGIQQIYLRAMDSLEARPIPAPKEPTAPFFSPDCQWLGFFAGNKLKKVSMSGERCRLLVMLRLWRGQLEQRGDDRVRAPWASVLRQVRTGRRSATADSFEKGEINHRCRSSFPRQSRALCCCRSEFRLTTRRLPSRRTGQAKTEPDPRGDVSSLLALRTPAYAQGGGLMAVPFRSAAAESWVGGPRRRGRLAIRTPEPPIQLFWQWMLVYVTGGVQEDRRRLVWVNRNGAEQPVAAPARAFMFVRLSPDARRVAASIADNRTCKSGCMISRGDVTRFTFEGNRNLNSVWTTRWEADSF